MLICGENVFVFFEEILILEWCSMLLFLIQYFRIMVLFGVCPDIKIRSLVNKGEKN